jgi:hypothetical protein
LGVLVVACGSSNNNNATNSSLRLVNATQSATLSATLNNTTQFSSVAAAAASAYASVTPGNYTVTVSASSGSLISSTQSFGLGSAQTYSLLGYDRDGAVFATLFTENQLVPASGYGTFAVTNLSPDSGPLDMFVVAVGTTSVSSLTPTFADVQSGASPFSTSLLAGSYAIFATATGNPNDVRLTIPSLTITNGEIVTFALTSTPGGALVNGVLLTQGGSVQFAPTTNARVRVVSALPVSPASAVAATVGSTPLASVFSPNPGSYTSVPGGSTSYTVSVAGTAVATVPAATFATGGDFTILVYGTVSSPSISIFTDNNQLPASSGIKLRLVNAGVTATGGLSMYVNNIQVANSLGYGAASAYFNTAVATTSTLQLIEAGLAPVSATISTSTPGAIYTVFVIDTTLTPYVIRDR